MTKLCKVCKTPNASPMDPVCSWECAKALLSSPETKAKQKAALAKIERKSLREAKKRVRTRPQEFAILQSVLNSWIVHVRDAGKPCFTCGTNSQSIKYDAGHRWHAGRGGADRRRFVEINIHKQCSMACNNYGSGKPVEYDQALDDTYGEGTAEYLACEANYPTLKERYPTTEDIRDEAARYRKMLTDNGIKARR